MAYLFKQPIDANTNSTRDMWDVCCVCRFGGPTSAWSQDTHHPPPPRLPLGVTTSNPPGGSSTHRPPAGFTSSVPHMPLLHITNSYRPAQPAGRSTSIYTDSEIVSNFTHNEQEGILVECQSPACWQSVLHSKQIWTWWGGGGVGPYRALHCEENDRETRLKAFSGLV